jgi:isoaspartyl peptidase/L-asparaginase-like protein (Ntn-hydrolase superfamily)
MKARSSNTITVVILAAAVWANSCLAQFPGVPSLPIPGWGSGAANAAAAAAVARLVVYIIETREASERQKQIAEERARHAYANMSTKRKAQLKAKKVRYIAVDTEKDAKTSRQAKKSVMVWDTDRQEIANDRVYDIQKSPPVGETAKFDRYSAEYVGSGS